MTEHDLKLGDIFVYTDKRAGDKFGNMYCVQKISPFTIMATNGKILLLTMQIHIEVKLLDMDYMQFRLHD